MSLVLQPTSKFEIISNPTINATVFTLEFDQQVFAQLPEGRIALTDARLNTLKLQETSIPNCPSRIPEITTKLHNLFKISCFNGIDTYEFPSLSNSGCARDFSGLSTAQSVVEPGGTFLNLINGGLVLPTESTPIRFVVIGKLSSDLAKRVFSDPSKVICSITRGPNPNSLVDQQGMAADYSLRKLQYKSNCWGRSIEHLKVRMASIYEHSNSVTNLQKLQQIKNSVFILIR